MKFFKISLVSGLLLLGLQSCKKDKENFWKTEIRVPETKVEITDISKEFFDPNIPIEQFKAKYPWFQGSVKDEDFKNRRVNPEEIKVYREAVSKIDRQKLSAELTELFARIKHYLPLFSNPKVFIFSSSTQLYQDPIIYDPDQRFLFIDISSFMGSNNAVYKGIEDYLKKNMNPENIIPRVSESIAYTMVPFEKEEQKFLNLMLYSGKIMTLQDAFLPTTPDHLKMNLSKEQYEWSVAHEADIWNYFIENDLIYSPDPRLVQRFIAPGPFSKFYTEADNESAPQVGVFTGWQIARKYFSENPETQLKDFLKMNASDIFSKSGYKPQ